MTKSMKSLMMGAALAGFMAGNTAMAQVPSSTNNAVSNGSSFGHLSTSFDKEKHACKGQNSCKGKGFLQMTPEECKDAQQKIRELLQGK